MSPLLQGYLHTHGELFEELFLNVLARLRDIPFNDLTCITLAVINRRMSQWSTTDVASPQNLETAAIPMEIFLHVIATEKVVNIVLKTFKADACVQRLLKCSLLVEGQIGQGPAVIATHMLAHRPILPQSQAGRDKHDSRAVVGALKPEEEMPIAVTNL